MQLLQALETRKLPEKEAAVKRGLEAAATDKAREALVRIWALNNLTPQLVSVQHCCDKLVASPGCVSTLFLLAVPQHVQHS